MNNTIKPPIKTRNRIKENQALARISHSIKHTIRAWALIKVIITIGWADIVRTIEIKRDVTISIFISAYRI